MQKIGTSMEIVLSLVAAFAVAYTIIYTPFRNLLPKISKTSSKTSDKTEVPEAAKETPIESIKAVEPIKETLVAPTKPVEVTKKPLVAVEDKTVAKNFIPEDSMLKRHYLTHLQAISETQATSTETKKTPIAPIKTVEPTEETPVAPTKLVEAIKKPLVAVKNEPLVKDFIPEDSMLKRHYLTHLQAISETQATSTEVKKAPVVPTKTVEATKKPLVAVENKKVIEDFIPEDSMLKRHFLTNLRASIESELSPRPTCSTLGRHHDALVTVEMDKRLQIAA